MDVEVDEQYTEPRAVQEEYSEPYVEQVPHEESYEVPETFEMWYLNSAPFFTNKDSEVSLVSLRFTRIRTFQLTGMVQKVRMAQKQRTVMKDVTKCRTAYRTVTHYDTKTRRVT